MRDSEKTNCHHKGSNSMSQKSKLSVEEKAEIIRKYQQGEISLSQAARYAEVGLTTIYRWSARYEAEGVTGLLPYQKNRVYPPELKLK
ncbi:MAG: helix-turn-helix domain-containing protein, partial [Lawsonibacter sp.]|uniref:helix-turn-helix domain-containing protein n=1 Tax=Flintibacter sp. TaxID=1918624 RepID=UPI002672DBDF